MSTLARHTKAICASKVQGTKIFSLDGHQIGHVEDVILDKFSNNIMFAVLAFGGFLGLGEKFHPVPWSLLEYREEIDGYVLPMSREVLEKAPAYDLSELVKDDGQAGVRWKAFDYYKVPQYE